MYKTFEEAQELFEHWSENLHFHPISTDFDLHRSVGSNKGINGVSHSVNLFRNVDSLSKKINQLLCTNNVTNGSFMEDVGSICANFMHAFVDYLRVSKFDYLTE